MLDDTCDKGVERLLGERLLREVHDCLAIRPYNLLWVAEQHGNEGGNAHLWVLLGWLLWYVQGRLNAH